MILAPQIDFTAGQVRQLKEFYAEFFDGPAAGQRGEGIGAGDGRGLPEAAGRTDATARAGGAVSLPGAPLDAPIAVLRNVIGKPYTFYLTELRGLEDDLFAQKERVIDPIRRFMAGAQRQIYDDAQRYLEAQEPNFSYAGGDEARRIRAILDDPACCDGNRMTQAKTLLDALRDKVDRQVNEEKTRTAQADRRALGASGGHGRVR